MSNDKPAYVSLAKGRRISLFARHFYRLWLAPDHLLYVEAAEYRETWRRFYLKDIQALTLVRDNRSRFAAWLWGGLALVSFFIALLFFLGGRDLLAGAIFMAFSALGFVLGLVITLWRGPSCEVAIQTAVQTQPLLAISTVREAETVFERLRQVITAAQGAVDPATLSGPAPAEKPVEGVR